ncbi:acyl-CoA dehydrogenase family protein [Hymenobacter jeollabukensis]|uniref:Acyl-CoA dehydrogenase family protein n=1 Tax=Hymenobacter jeollabukensis TaxID=2025313 RepID=A0A5R8WIR2_9BACT|nr:acyl-CoA dehydrogenase family protein [Hymenobacter jeollabukensis]TLM88560.1 acyl-CoA dehydrogenase family protein [Hymenobacter jeollabukensis]
MNPTTTHASASAIDKTSSSLLPAAAVAAAAHLTPRLFAHAPQSDHEGGFPREEFHWLHEAGLLTAGLPAALGGAGLNQPGHLAEQLRVLQHIGAGNLAVGRVYEGHLNALQLIERFGTGEQLRRYAADAQAGHLFGVWNTEAQDGVHLEPLPDGRFRLRGSKTFGSGAGQLTRPLLTGARPDGGWQLFVLPTDAQPPRLDPTFWQPLGMRATASFRVEVTGLEIGPADLIGPPGDYYRQPWFSGGAVRFAAVQLGGAAAVLDATRGFLRGLGRTDDPYQRQRLGEMTLLVESGQLWLTGAAARYPAPEQEEAQAEGIVAYANMVRTAIEDICLRVLQLAERSVGARGLLRPHPLERLHRDLTHYLRQPAPDAALADVGRFALTHDAPAAQLWQPE